MLVTLSRRASERRLLFSAPTTESITHFCLIFWASPDVGAPPINSETFLVLLSDAQKGDRAALGTLLTSIYIDISKVIRRLSGERVAAQQTTDDIAQDVCVEISKRIGSFVPGEEPSRSFRSWARAIAATRVRQVGRVGKSRGLLQLVEEIWKLDSPGAAPTPSQTLSKRELHGIVVDCLKRLDVTDREVLVLHHLESATLSEIAEILDISPGAVGMRLARARQRLKDLLGGTAFYDRTC